MAEMTAWLWERLFAPGGLLERLQPLGVDQEAEIQRICEQELADWWERPTMTVRASLQEPLRHARTALREKLELRKDNQWFNPGEGAFEHLSLKYLNLSNEEWTEMRAGNQERVQNRIAIQQRIRDPDVLVRKAAELLAGQQWYQLALGITLATGRRLTEVLKTGKFSPKTAYSVWFEGQLKTKDRVLPPYEIPTLVRASLVLEAVSRLRNLLDCSHMSNDAVSDQYGLTMRNFADQQLVDLIPKRTQEENLFTHLSRSVYARLCVWCFCPQDVLDLDYMASVLGHYWYFKEQDLPRRRNLSSTLYYYDYYVDDGHGRLQGTRLGDPDVHVLTLYSQEEASIMQQPTRRRRKKQPLGPLETTVPKSHSLVRCTPGDKVRFNEEAKNRQLIKEEDVFTALLNEVSLYQQMAQLLLPLKEELEASAEAEPLQVLQALLERYQGGQQDAAVSRHLETRWGVSLAQIDALFEQAQAEGHQQPFSFFEKELAKGEKFRAGAQKRAERYQQTDFTKLKFSELEGSRAPEAAQERVRRIVKAIMRYNSQADARDRWFINAAKVNELKTTRHEIIKAYLDAHKNEITLHHQALGIEPRHNLKLDPIAKFVIIPGHEPPG